MPEAPVEFVDGVSVLTHGEIGTARELLTAITHKLNVMALGGMRMVWVGACHHVVSFQVFVGGLIQGLVLVSSRTVKLLPRGRYSPPLSTC